MSLNQLNAISPIDGRYRSKVQSLANFFSEEALIKYRVMVEIEYFIALCELELPQLPALSQEKVNSLRSIFKNFSLEDALVIKEIEQTTNHDVKAVEYFIKDKFDALGLEEYKEFIHFALTSQDINNTAIPYSIKEAMNEAYVPLFMELTDLLRTLVKSWENIPMLARTHGQPASPTTLGKEMLVFHERLESQYAHLREFQFFAKFGGATGSFNAHVAAYPNIEWRGELDQFI